MNINAAIHNFVSLLSALVSFLSTPIMSVPPVFISNHMALEEAKREQTPCLLVHWILSLPSWPGSSIPELGVLVFEFSNPSSLTTGQQVKPLRKKGSNYLWSTSRGRFKEFLFSCS